MTINLTTGEVHKFDSETGEAKLSAIDNASETARNAAKAINGLHDKTVTITTVLKSVVQSAKEKIGFATPNVKGTRNFEGGLATENRLNENAK